MDDRARVTLSVQEGKLEIEGSEAFVEKQLERLDGVLQTLLSETSKKLAARRVDPPDAKTNNGRKISHDGYERVFVVTDERIQILKSPPGTNNKERTVNLVLLYLLASSVGGTDTVSFEDLRAACKEHSCFDSGNFAATITGRKQFFLVEGSGQSRTARLTVPGREKAQELAAQLNTSE